jgi:small-conductance mechanosensitive channel
MRWSLESRIVLVAAIVILVLLSGLALAPRGHSLIDLLGSDARHLLQLPLFTLGKLVVTPIFLVKAFVFLVALSLLSSRLSHLVYVKLAETKAISHERSYLLARFVSLAMYVIGFMIGLELAGVSLNTLAILAGTLGIGIGFGLQSLVANWVAGLVLLVEQPVRIGDCIAVGKNSGVVVRIGGRGTSVRTYDNELLIIPNSTFTNTQVTNWSEPDPKIRLSIPIGVSYDSDPQKVREVLLKIAGQHPDVLTDPAPEVVIAELGDSTLNFLLRFWRIIGPEDNYRIKSDLYYSILKVFAEQKIEMPFPQHDLHVRSVDAPILISNVPPTAES